MAKRVAVAFAIIAVIATQTWTVRRLAVVRADLSAATSGLEEARGSLAMLWETTNRLDEDQMARLGVLADSIRTVFAYAQGEIRLWEAAYYAQERRLDDNAERIGRADAAITRMTTAARTVNTRLDELARANEAQLSRLEALAREDRTHGSLIETLAQRARTQESSVAEVTTTVAALRRTLADLDAELVDFEDRLSASSSAWGRMDTRIDGLAGWIDGFRRAGLSGDVVGNRLSALSEEMRRMRMRVDSLRPARTGVAASQ